MPRPPAALLALSIAVCGCSSSTSSSNVRSAITYVTSSPLGLAERGIVGVPFLLTPFVQTDAFDLPGSAPNTTAVSASCDGDACTAEVASDHPGTFRITPTKAQATNVNVHVDNAQAGALSGSYAMTFAAPGASVVINLSSPNIDIDHLAYASLPGATFDLGGWPGFDGREAGFDGAVTWTADSDAFALTSSRTDGQSETFTASHPGVAHVTITAGPVSRTAAFTVADVATTKSVALHALAPLSAPSDEIALSQDLSPDPVASVDVSSVDVSFAVVLTMADGSKAVGGAEKLTATPAGLVKLAARNHGELLVASVVRAAPGKGTISGTIGTATFTIPFSVK